MSAVDLVSDNVFASFSHLCVRAVLPPGPLRCNQFGNADQVIGGQIEQEVGGDASDARCLVVRMVPCCLHFPKTSVNDPFLAKSCELRPAGNLLGSGDDRADESRSGGR
jgi:hypothetical protein